MAADAVVDERLPVARLLARLLLTELDGPTLAELGRPEVAAALAELGVVLPIEPELDELAAEFFAAFVQPAESAPPVQSLWMQGTYEGQSAGVVRELARATGVEFDRTVARGAPVDHLGAILLLWCEARELRPEVADRLEAEHMEWALRPLAHVARGGGFYGGVCGAAGEFLRTLRPDDVG